MLQLPKMMSQMQMLSIIAAFHELDSSKTARKRDTAPPSRHDRSLADQW
jgi:hypothetical protein